MCKRFDDELYEYPKGKKSLGGRTTFKRSSAGEVGMRQRKKIMPTASKKAGLDRLGK